MVRSRGTQHKIRYEVESVRQKCLENRLRHLVRHDYGVCEAETCSVVRACLDYLRATRPDDRGPLDVRLDVPEGRAVRWKVSPERAVCRRVVLSALSADDTDVRLEQGPRAMQTARAVRLVEQTDRAQCTMPLSLLVSLVHLTSRTLTSRLATLWQQGLYLPVVGIPESSAGTRSRVAEVFRGHLEGLRVDEVRRNLVLSPARHGDLFRSATTLVQGYVAGEDEVAVGHRLGLGPVEAEGVLEVARRSESSSSCRQRLDAVLASESVSLLVSGGLSGPSTSLAQLRSAFEAHLMRHHRFSPSRAELLSAAVDDVCLQWTATDRAPGEIVYWAVGQDEPAGKALEDCELVAARLPFYVPDEDRVPCGTVGDLKVRKAVRLATYARGHGGLLSLADLAFLLGMGANSVQEAIARTGVFVPTRGTMADIGPGVSHKKRIVRLYVEGYTEPQIVRRTHHTYESVGSYIDDFRRVMVLVDRGLPPSHIRKVLRMSLRLVNEYIALYRELDVPDYQWKLNLMRRAARHQEKKRRGVP